ncbi:cytochrome c oxidase assembly protein [Pseudorhodoplanes sinuspersici]|nr:cytochrome c oxidase assembly protein [Pseudorhodoplanes sinuspersici]
MTRRYVASIVIILLSSTPVFGHGSVAGHMIVHIGLMNIAAPLLALAALSLPLGMTLRSCSCISKTLPAATLAQIFVLWTTHVPVIFAAVVAGVVALAATQTLLFLLALWFWLSVLVQPARDFWRASLALLVTGKLFCLLGALLVFAPRPLYASTFESSHIQSIAEISSDQQLAGLLMLFACPATYVLAGIILASRGLRALDTQQAPLTLASVPRTGVS